MKLHIMSWNSIHINIAVTWLMRGLTAEIQKHIYVAE
jgi:hypothetical protein